MKTWILIIWGAFLLASCFDDKGNYEYTELGEMTVTGINTDEWYEVFAFSDTLDIRVDIQSTRYTNGEEPYTYQWKLETTGDKTHQGDTVLDYTVSREKNLHIVPTLKAGEYYGFFIVTDTLLGLQEKVDFFVRLKTSTSEGWMVLCEEDGEARLDWIVNLTDSTDRIYRDLWRDLDVKLGKPYGLASAYSFRKSNRYVFAENGTFNIDKDDAHVGEDNNVKWQFGDAPDILHGLATEIAVQRNNWLDLLVTREKNLYIRNAMQPGTIYGFPVNRTADGNRFDVAPYFGHTYGGWDASVILYDETNRRFMEIADDNSNIPRLLSFAGGRVDFPAETGRDMVYMNWTTNKYTYAVLQDPQDGEMYVYGIKVDGDKNYRDYYTQLKRTEGDKITHIAFHSLYAYMFYATDKSEIYRFDLDHPTDPAVKVLSFPGETITALKINKLLLWGKPAQYKPWEVARENRLVIGSNITAEVEKGNEESCGIMRTYDVPALRQPMEDKQVKYHDKLGKIVDIVYRERGN